MIITVFSFLCAAVATGMADSRQKSGDYVSPQKRDCGLADDSEMCFETCHPDMCQLVVKLDAMETQLAAGEKRAEKQNHTVTELRAIVTKQAALLTQQKEAVEKRADKQDKATAELKAIVTKQATLLTQQQATINEEKAKLARLSSSVSALTSTVQKLETQLRDQKQQVAFSASLYSYGNNKYLGPFNQDRTVVLRRVLTNIGNGYSSSTGEFTAPVSGVYYVTFTAFAVFSPKRVYLRKNGYNIASVTDQKDDEDSATNGAVLWLRKGDRVYLVLHGSRNTKHKLYDDQFRFTTFSGFLLYR